MIFKSPHTSVKIPDLDLPTFMFTYARKNTVFGQNPNLITMIQHSQSLTFADFERQTDEFASGLHNNLEFQRGDILAAILPNTPFYPIITMGTLLLGGVVNTANPAYTARELSHQLKMTQPKVIVTMHDFLATTQEAIKLSGLSIPKSHIITVDNGDNSLQQIYSTRHFPRVYLTAKKQTAQTPAFIVFSSGTSGAPKGVVLSHRNLVANAMQFLEVDRADYKLAQAVGHRYQRRWLQVLPMFHIYGILVTNAGILTGAVVVMMDNFNFPGFCALLQDHKADTVYVAPPIILALAKSPEVKKYDLSSLKYINSGAAPLGKELQAEAERKLGVFVTQGFGMSEASPLISRSACGVNTPGSIGPLCSNTEVVFIDNDGKHLGVNQTGEICIRGPQVMLGYYKNEAATAETIQSDGYLHTGDIGYIDANNNIYITDRKKELIKYKGFQIAPAELESLLTDHPDVIDAAVIPVYDEARVSEIPKAFVVVRSEAQNRIGINAEIAGWLATRVIDYKKLRGGVELIDVIPKSATGKILRRVLKDLEASRKSPKTKL
ncbi:4-coumarate-CoA ligase [Kickxella alabastrina]|uniref:4-coumarate-CoA ligase n=1 Tax=Kickxella alabastrina TaxID=61397 RepID=UPI0022202A20|nr:4-coumarate-CoA ligase [Kickxella alabastrina]KAI7833018.1 4-coumarate-CoA ligase [Kickxella alabastrina]